MVDTPLTSRSSLSSFVSLETEAVGPPFRFFAFPGELRRHILSFVVVYDRTLDIDFRSSSLLSCFLVSHRFRAEAAAIFYESNTFRLLPTHPRAASRKAKPLIRMIEPRYRISLTSLELRLGPFWTAPPACWKIDNSLGLETAVRVRTLRIFVECDPSQPMYKGFRKSESFYTNFTGKLLVEILKRLPSLKEVRIDGNPSVSSTGPLVYKLAREVEKAGKRIVWGPNMGLDSVIEGLEKVGQAELRKERLLTPRRSISTWELGLCLYIHTHKMIQLRGNVVCILCIMSCDFAAQRILLSNIMTYNSSSTSMLPFCAAFVPFVSPFVFAMDASLSIICLDTETMLSSINC